MIAVAAVEVEVGEDQNAGVVPHPQNHVIFDEAGGGGTRVIWPASGFRNDFYLGFYIL